MHAHARQQLPDDRQVVGVDDRRLGIASCAVAIDEQDERVSSTLEELGLL